MPTCNILPPRLNSIITSEAAIKANPANTTCDIISAVQHIVQCSAMQQVNLSLSY
jgi:hypothetical protein